MKKKFLFVAVVALFALSSIRTFAQQTITINKGKNDQKTITINGANIKINGKEIDEPIEIAIDGNVKINGNEVKSVARSYNGKNYTLIENKSFSAKYRNITEIRVSQTVLDVNITPSNSAESNVDMFFKKVMVNDPEYKIYVKQNGSVLDIYQEPKSGLSFTQSSGYINITAPNGVKVVNVNAISGDVSIKGLDLEKANIKSVSGDVTASSANISNAELKTTSGDVKMQDLSLGNMNVSSISGDISSKAVKTSLFSVKSTSGDIGIYDIKCEKVDVSTISGDIKIDRTTCPLVKTKTTSGDTSALLSGVRELYNATISGDITIYLDSDLKKNSYHFSSVSGEIEIEGFARARKSLDMNNSDAPADITVKTTSGDVVIKKW